MVSGTVGFGRRVDRLHTAVIFWVGNAPKQKVRSYFPIDPVAGLHNHRGMNRRAFLQASSLDEYAGIRDKGIAGEASHRNCLRAPTYKTFQNMRTQTQILILTFTLAFANLITAQTNSMAPAASNAPSAVVPSQPRANPAIIPVSRTGGTTNRQTQVLQRAKDNPGPCDIIFVGDSITQGWEQREGRNVWTNYYGARKCLNFGVSGDCTQHVLWRFEQGQLNGINPKVAVLMIGTNNSNTNRDGSEQYSTAEILEGVQAVVKQMHERLPNTKLLVLGIFPRGAKFNAQRGRILQINQALAKMADDKSIFYADFGSQLVEADGSISRSIMPDYLHLTEKGYGIWAEAIEPKLKELLK